MMTKHPLETILEWFRNLPPADRNWAAVRFVSALPSENDDLPFEAVADGEQLMENWLSIRGFHTQDLGRTIATRALIDFVLVREAVHDAYWVTLREKQKAVLRHLEESGDEVMAKKMQARLLDMPRLEASWREAARQWRQLVEGELSDSALAEWSQSQELDEQARSEADAGRSKSNQERR